MNIEIFIIIFLIVIILSLIGYTLFLSKAIKEIVSISKEKTALSKSFLEYSLASLIVYISNQLKQQQQEPAVDIIGNIQKKQQDLIKEYSELIGKTEQAEPGKI